MIMNFMYDEGCDDYLNLKKQAETALQRCSYEKCSENMQQIYRETPVLNNFVTDMKTKANIFNEFFAELCTPLKNNCVIPKQSSGGVL